MTNQSDLSSILADCHAAYHFPNNTSNGSGFVHYDLHRVTSFSSNFCQANEALQPVLMVIASPHCLDMTDENDQIYLYVPDSHRDPLSRIKNPSFQRS